MKGDEYMKKVSWIIASIVVAIAIVLDILLFISGSFETFPAAEQIEKGRIAYGLLLVLFAIMETFILIRIVKKK